MSQEIDLRKDNGGDDDYDGEWPNTASVPPPPLSRKRPRHEDVGNEDSQVLVDHRKSHEGIAAAASHPITLASELTSRNDGSTNTYSQKLSTLKPPSNSSGQQGRGSVWEDRLSELAEYRKIHGRCNVPKNYSKNAKLASWVSQTRTNYRLHKEGKTSPMTLSRIQQLESLGFEWGRHASAWEDRLSELAEYRKIHGHCNVPYNYSKSAKLGRWVATQRTYYRLQKERKTSSLTTFRIQELESLGFEWGRHASAWEDRLSELAEYRKIHGHCNVPQNYSKNTKLGWWVANQRGDYRMHKEGKTSPMTLSRIHELECLDFAWKARIVRNKGTSKKPSLDDDLTRVREPALEAPEHVQTTSQTQKDFSGRERCSFQVDVTLEPEESDWNGEVRLTYIPGRTEEI
jgi:hypothetical protein